MDHLELIRSILVTWQPFSGQVTTKEEMLTVSFLKKVHTLKGPLLGTCTKARMPGEGENVAGFTSVVGASPHTLELAAPATPYLCVVFLWASHLRFV